MIEQNDIGFNVRKVLAEVGKTAAECNRNPDDIRLIAVSKTVTVDKVREAIGQNLIDFGENRVQELVKKYDILGETCNWHLIGSLQTNKVKFVVDKISLLHSLDRLELAQEIQKRAEKCERIINALVQVNVSGEESKSGMEPKSLEDFLYQVSKYPNVKIRGLMTIAPYADDPEEVRWVFRETNKLFIDISSERIDNIDMRWLSMGMSNDYKIAIEEGANMIRIGSAIFGERVY